MKVDEFLNNVRSQEVVTLERDVSVPGPQAQTLLASGRAITLAEHLNHPDRRIERRTFRYCHLTGPGLSAAELDNWQDRFRDYPLPQDLRHFLMQADGVHLWADIEEQRAYFGILPLEDWTDAASGPYAHVFETPPRAALIISYRHDTAGFAVLDTDGPSYFWCDLYDSPELIGTTVEDLLAHWWGRVAVSIRAKLPSHGRAAAQQALEADGRLVATCAASLSPVVMYTRSPPAATSFPDAAAA